MRGVDSENLSGGQSHALALEPASEEMFRFPSPLEEGTVISRPNRFIMMVKAGGKTIKCHCPTTGRLGDAKISSLPCLFSRSAPGARKTQGTVQAISFDSAATERRSWIGINQNAANRYIEFFLEKGLLSRMASGSIRREAKLGRSRIDFLVGDTYVAGKTPLLIRHMTELSAALGEGKKAVIAMCFLYDAAPFRPPPRDRYNARILDAARSAAESGVRRWQVNLRVEADGVRLVSYDQNDVEPPAAPAS